MMRQPQGGTLIFSYIRRLGSIFGVPNFEFQYFLGFSEKLLLLYFFFFGGGGVWRFCDISLASSQNWTIFRSSFLCILGSF